MHLFGNLDATGRHIDKTGKQGAIETPSKARNGMIMLIQRKPCCCERECENNGHCEVIRVIKVCHCH